MFSVPSKAWELLLQVGEATNHERQNYSGTTPGVMNPLLTDFHWVATVMGWVQKEGGLRAPYQASQDNFGKPKRKPRCCKGMDGSAVVKDKADRKTNQ